MFSRQTFTYVVFIIFFAILPGRVIAVLLHQKASNEDSLWTYNRSRYEFVSSDEPIKCMLRESFLDEWKNYCLNCLFFNSDSREGVNRRRFSCAKTLPIPVNSTLYLEISFKL